MTAAGDVTSPSRVPLSRERVLRAAVAFADEHGVAALSMRKLARGLGYEVMSLYNHVASKDEVLDGMVDLVAAEMESPAGEGPWRAAVRRSAVSAREALRRHPWASELWTRRWPGPARLRHMDSLLGRLRGAGFSAYLAHHAFHAVDQHVVGFTIQELSFTADPDALAEGAARFLREVPAASYPHLVEHVQLHASADAEGDGFAFVLDLILDGLERARHRGGTEGRVDAETARAAGHRLEEEDA